MPDEESRLILKYAVPQQVTLALKYAVVDVLRKEYHDAQLSDAEAQKRIAALIFILDNLFMPQREQV